MRSEYQLSILCHELIKSKYIMLWDISWGGEGAMQKL